MDYKLNKALADAKMWEALANEYKAEITDLTKEKNRFISLSIQYSKRISELEKEVFDLKSNIFQLEETIEELREPV